MYKKKGPKGKRKKEVIKRTVLERLIIDKTASEAFTMFYSFSQLSGLEHSIKKSLIIKPTR